MTRTTCFGCGGCDLQVQLGNGDSTFQKPICSAAAPEAMSLQLLIGDFNGDGILGTSRQRELPPVRQRILCMSFLVSDLRYSLRTLRKSLGFAVVAVLAMA